MKIGLNSLCLLVIRLLVRAADLFDCLALDLLEVHLCPNLLELSLRPVLAANGGKCCLLFGILLGVLLADKMKIEKLVKG